jgi:putative oxidoreductase
MGEIDAGLAILRFTVGPVMAGHGAQKLFGWFGGSGPDGTGQWMESVGLRPGRPMAAMSGVCETTGGLLLSLGLLNPVGPTVILGVMLVAIATHASQGVWSQQGGYEYPMTVAAIATALAFTGPGDVSLDHAFGADRVGYGWGMVAVVAAMAAAAPVLLRRAGALRQALSDRKA